MQTPDFSTEIVLSFTSLNVNCKQANQSSLHSLALLRQTKVPCKPTGMLFKLTRAKHLDFTLCQLGFDQ